jgi:hypothetical protein
MAAAATIEAKLFRPLHLGQLGIAYTHLDQPETAIALLDEALATLKRPKSGCSTPSCIAIVATNPRPVAVI